MASGRKFSHEIRGPRHRAALSSENRVEGVNSIQMLF